LEQAAAGPVRRAAGVAVGGRAEPEPPHLPVQVADVDRVDEPVEIAVHGGGSRGHGIVQVRGVVRSRVAPEDAAVRQVDHEEALSALVAVRTDAVVGVAGGPVVTAAHEPYPFFVSAHLHAADRHLAVGVSQVGGLGARRGDPPLVRRVERVGDVEGVIAAVVGARRVVDQAEVAQAVRRRAPEVRVRAAAQAEHEQGLPVRRRLRLPLAGAEPGIGHRDGPVHEVDVGHAGRVRGMRDLPKLGDHARRDEAPGLGAIGGPEGVQLAVVGAGQHDPQPVGGRPHMACTVRGEGVGAVVDVPVVVRRRPHRHGVGPEDVAQFPVVLVVGWLAPDVSHDLVAPGIVLDAQVRGGDVGCQKIDEGATLVGLHDPCVRVALLQELAGVPDRAPDGPVAQDLVLAKVPEPHGVVVDGLEGRLIEEVLVGDA